MTLSTCCNAPAVVSEADEGTQCYVCEKCGKPIRKEMTDAEFIERRRDYLLVNEHPHSARQRSLEYLAEALDRLEAANKRIAVLEFALRPDTCLHRGWHEREEHDGKGRCVDCGDRVKP